ncbi:MAG: hypothetical protein P9M06_00760 [Candidatus Saelkia tenebricola]|nr:hypothetical protein [Candidatus Saelkia tenebricola]
MTTAVKDANIIFDLFDINLLYIFFNLNFDVCITDFVLNEIKEPSQKEIIDNFIIAGKLELLETPKDEISKLTEIRDNFPGLTIADCSIIYHAKKNKAFILTGDSALKNYAESNKLEVHGILWVLDELIREGRITKKIANSKLTQLMEINSRLPKKECEKRLKNWS